VFSQNPVGGTKVEPGTTVVIQVSRGDAAVAVQGVVGSTIDEAESRLRAQGFEVVRQPDPRNPKPEGEVLSQAPEAGTLLEIGQPVTLVFSQPEPIMIPDVKGQDPATASASLTRLGFVVEAAQEPSETIEAGKVTRTNPPAGEQLKFAQKITLYTSTGFPTVAVPPVVGLSTDNAIRTLQDAGFVVRAMPQDVAAGSAEAGRVISQEPVGNTQQRKGSTVVINYGRPSGGGSGGSTTTTPPTTTTTP
jgi:serine/threonine-protein kinase